MSGVFETGSWQELDCLVNRKDVLFFSDQATSRGDSKVRAHNLRNKGFQRFRQQQLRSVLPVSQRERDVPTSLHPTAVLQRRQS